MTLQAITAGRRQPARRPAGPPPAASRLPAADRRLYATEEELPLRQLVAEWRQHQADDAAWLAQRQRHGITPKVTIDVPVAQVCQR